MADTAPDVPDRASSLRSKLRMMREARNVPARNSLLPAAKEEKEKGDVSISEDVIQDIKKMQIPSFDELKNKKKRHSPNENDINISPTRAVNSSSASASSASQSSILRTTSTKPVTKESERGTVDVSPIPILQAPVNTTPDNGDDDMEMSVCDDMCDDERQDDAPVVQCPPVSVVVHQPSLMFEDKRPESDNKPVVERDKENPFKSVNHEYPASTRIQRVPLAVKPAIMCVMPVTQPTPAPAPPQATVPAEPEHAVSKPSVRQPTSSANTSEDSVIVVNGNRYIKLELIGKGGSSKVYKAMSPNRKIYAIKKVKWAPSESSLLVGYRNEIHLLESLRGIDYIVQLIEYEVVESACTLYVVLEYGEIDLARMLTKMDKLSPNYARHCWQEMLKAVSVIHEHRIVHGDIKPANFIIVEGQIKLIDFGIAKAISNDTTHIQRDSQVGTLNYMSPEAILVSQDHKVGRASDVWSLGCILYQMVYKTLPFQHLSVVQKLHAITNEKFVINFPPTDPMVVDVIKRCLSRDPSSRPTIPQLLEHTYLMPVNYDSVWSAMGLTPSQICDMSLELRRCQDDDSRKRVVKAYLASHLS